MGARVDEDETVLVSGSGEACLAVVVICRAKAAVELHSLLSGDVTLSG